ncbi:hypothetical protein EDC96DRAFT_443728 [Choanephora cucurbitarum]|nr:hypothetical protein EDC96DRAFT_443728 [Choanephora cucurbitarum]
MPTSEQSSAANYINSNWAVSNTNFYGNEDVSFVKDPVTNNATVLQVKYPAGSYAPVGSRTSTGTVGGVEFFSTPEQGKMYNTALLSYDLAFDSNFNWVKGGKLPGIFGGPTSEGCSGGEKATGSNCFSVRLMWRANGAGEAYAYIPTSDKLCNSKQVICNSDYGTSFSRGVIQFSTNKWTRLEIYVKLNSGSNSNGILQVWQDGSLMINQQNIQFRSNDAIAVSSIMFSTFFGGGSLDYATSADTYTYFKNIQFSVGNTPEPKGDNSASSLSTPVYSLIALSGCLLSLFVF